MPLPFTFNSNPEANNNQTFACRISSINTVLSDNYHCTLDTLYFLIYPIKTLHRSATTQKYPAHIYLGSLSDNGDWFKRLSSICCTQFTTLQKYYRFRINAL